MTRLAVEGTLLALGLHQEQLFARLSEYLFFLLRERQYLFKQIQLCVWEAMYMNKLEKSCT
jgi:hypothetical protein